LILVQKQTRVALLIERETKDEKEKRKLKKSVAVSQAAMEAGGI
jgi:hypothetical protein